METQLDAINNNEVGVSSSFGSETEFIKEKQEKK